MKQQKKLSTQEQQQATEVQSQQTGQAAREFASADELLRFDAKQTIVPPEVGQRLGRSLQNEPRPAKPWWRRWLGK
jgi:hypothetical protein